MAELSHPRTSGVSAVAGPTDFADNENVNFGDDNDFALRFDTGLNEFVIEDVSGNNNFTFPKGVSIDIDSHAGRHEGGADPVDLGQLSAGDDAFVEFGAAPDFSIGYNSTANEFRILDETAGAPQDLIRVLKKSQTNTLEIRRGHLTLAGNQLRQVGGTADAGSGAIRLANNSAINWRSSEDDSDHGFTVNASEDLIYSDAGTNRFAVRNGGPVEILNSQFNMSGILDMQGNNIQLGGDGTKLLFGASEDMSVRFDSGNDSLRWEDEGTSDRMELDRTSGNLNIEGTITEGATL